MTPDEYVRIHNKDPKDMEGLELVSPTADYVTMDGRRMPIDHDISNYMSMGILPREHDIPKKLIGFDGILRYFSETNPQAVQATELEIKTH